MLRAAFVASVLFSAHAIDWDDTWKNIEKKKVERKLKSQQDYLDARAKEADVVVLPSGLMYKVLKEGEGRFHPKPDTECDCHYKGNLIDGPNALGRQFDSSYDRGDPTTFAPNQVRPARLACSCVCLLSPVVPIASSCDHPRDHPCPPPRDHPGSAPF